MQTSNATRFEIMVRSIRRLLGLKFPESEETPPDTETLTHLYASGMFETGNWLHKLFIRRTVNHVRIDENHLETIKAKADQGTIVYVSVNLGQLEYNVLNSICLEQKLPLARFNNALRMRRWLPLKQIRESYRQRIDYLVRHEELPHPLLSGYIEKLVQEGKSLLFSIDEADPTYLSSPVRDFFNTLLETQKSSDKPIYVVPEQLIWDKRPKREKASMFEALFGETPHPGFFRKFILFLRHYRKRAIVRFGEAIPLADFLRTEEGGDLPLSLYQKILGSLEIEKRTLTGPPIRPRGWFLERISEDENLEKTIYEVAKERNKPVASVRRLALRYAREISADVHYSHIEFASVLTRWIFGNLFDGVVIDTEGLKNLKQALHRGPTILVPNHRSHLDYLLMAHICYFNDIVIPYVAAGMNLAFFPLGPYFRRCGAFFLRRTFTGNALYKNVFQTYLKVLIQEGYLQEFFIEGGRSRSGKLRAPKLGMLSMYAQVFTEQAAKDIQFIPVSITYDRVVEQKSYIKEIEGKPKLKEKTRDLLKLTKFLKGRYGKIYVNFDEPISLAKVADGIEETDWKKKKPQVVEMLGQKICHAINRQVVVIPQALAASALLLLPNRGVVKEEAQKTFGELLHYLRWKNVKLSDTLAKDSDGVFAEAISQCESAGLIKKHEGLEQSFFEIPGDKRLELDFFKNVSIHYFVSLALWSNLLLTSKTDRFPVETLVESYTYFQQLFQYEFRFSTRRPIKDHLDKLCCYLQERKLIEYSGGEIEILREGRPLLKEFSLLIRNFVEAYLIAWQTFVLRPMYPNDAKALTKAMMTHGKHQLLLGKIEYPESLSQTIFENAIQSFKLLGLFSIDSDEAKKLEEALEKLLLK
ncbi:MAG: 1-acyl-sn-glycerol-3-phosphate acyltransferase [Deltaproteobacteria bacterium]|nr:1-acyl-sn-glycerol-3-phosphate acyltransferase [Deltaproteobacteria bacterium]